MPTLPPSRRSSPLITALACQLVAALITFGGARLMVVGLGIGLPLWSLVLSQGLLAALISALVGMARWWPVIHLLAPPAVALGLWLAPPAWVYLGAFLLLALVFWNAAGERVPLFLTNRTTWAAIAELLPAGPFRFADLGCGLSGLLFYLAGQRPDGVFVGLENAPLPFVIARLRLFLTPRDNLTLRFKSLWTCDLSQFDVVYCFLSPAPMPALLDKARAQMRPGSLLISNSFLPPGRAPSQSLTLDDRRGTTLYLWRF